MKVLIIGATRGLGASLTTLYASDTNNTVFATSRSGEARHEKNVHWIPGIDIADAEAGDKVVDYLRQHDDESSSGGSLKLDIVILTAGYFGFETFDEPDFDKEVKMYTTSAIGPVFLVRSLMKAGVVRESSSTHSTTNTATEEGKEEGDGRHKKRTKTDTETGGKIIVVTSESGSIALRHEKEGGGNYGHHGSKAASNMVVKLLSLDLLPRGVAVVALHPGFMRTEMTKHVGFDRFYDDGGAVTPDEAAESLVQFVRERVDVGLTGQYWAPRGTAEAVLGKDLPTPLQLPW
ncbi:MAG: hypothetical protein M1838_002878 [Thelocarpon superellum]|nr:MAG: hypothetical protein M1838_002878 [Thelocarpon superellum]